MPQALLYTSHDFTFHTILFRDGRHGFRRNGAAVPGGGAFGELRPGGGQQLRLVLAGIVVIADLVVFLSPLSRSSRRWTWARCRCKRRSDWPPFAAALSTFRRVALVDGAYFTAARPYSRGFCEYLSVNLHIYRIFIRSPSPEYISCAIRQQGVSGHEKPPTRRFFMPVRGTPRTLVYAVFRKEYSPPRPPAAPPARRGWRTAAATACGHTPRCCPPPPGRPPPVPGR